MQKMLKLEANRFRTVYLPVKVAAVCDSTQANISIRLLLISRTGGASSHLQALWSTCSIHEYPSLLPLFYFAKGTFRDSFKLSACFASVGDEIQSHGKCGKSGIFTCASAEGGAWRSRLQRSLTRTAALAPPATRWHLAMLRGLVSPGSTLQAQQALFLHGSLSGFNSARSCGAVCNLGAVMLFSDVPVLETVIAQRAARAALLQTRRHLHGRGSNTKLSQQALHGRACAIPAVP